VAAAAVCWWGGEAQGGDAPAPPRPPPPPRHARADLNLIIRNLTILYVYLMKQVPSE
jgi:hypothetical protein